MIKKLWWSVVAVFVFGGVALAQAPTIHTLNVTSVAASLPGAGQSVVASITEPTLTVTQNVDLKEVTLVATSGNFKYFGGGFNYRLPVLSTKLNNTSPNLDGLKFRFSLVASAGVDHTPDGKQHIGFTGGGRFEYDFGSGTFAFGGGAEYAKFPGFANNTWIAYAGPSFHF